VRRRAASLPPRVAALLIEYGVWSLAIAAGPGTLAAAWVSLHPSEIYDEQRNVAEMFIMWGPVVLAVLVTPVAIMGLIRLARYWIKPAGQSDRVAPPVSPAPPKRVGSRSPTRLFAAYLVAVALTGPVIVVLFILFFNFPFFWSYGTAWPYIASTLISFVAVLPGVCLAGRYLLAWLFRRYVLGRRVPQN
jgi:hypothetical protein